MPSLSPAHKDRRGSPLSAPLTWPRSWVLLQNSMLYERHSHDNLQVCQMWLALNNGYLSLRYTKATNSTEVRPNLGSDYASHQNNSHLSRTLKNEKYLYDSHGIHNLIVKVCIRLSIIFLRFRKKAYFLVCIHGL